MTVGISFETAHYGYVLLNSYAGLSRRRVQVIGETPKKYRIKALERMKLAGRCRWIYAGESALVPKTAVELETP